MLNERSKSSAGLNCKNVTFHYQKENDHLLIEFRDPRTGIRDCSIFGNYDLMHKKAHPALETNLRHFHEHLTFRLFQTKRIKLNGSN